MSLYRLLQSMRVKLLINECFQMIDDKRRLIKQIKILSIMKVYKENEYVVISGWYTIGVYVVLLL